MHSQLKSFKLSFFNEEINFKIKNKINKEKLKVLKENMYAYTDMETMELLNKMIKINILKLNQANEKQVIIAVVLLNLFQIKLTKSNTHKEAETHNKHENEEHDNQFFVI